jgi:hypothetical protein
LPLPKVAPTPVIVKPPHALLWDCSVRDKSADPRFPPVRVGNTWQLSPLNLPPGSIFDFFRTWEDDDDDDAKGSKFFDLNPKSAKNSLCSALTLQRGYPIGIKRNLERLREEGSRRMPLFTLLSIALDKGLDWLSDRPEFRMMGEVREIYLARNEHTPREVNCILDQIFNSTEVDLPSPLASKPWPVYIPETVCDKLHKHVRILGEAIAWRFACMAICATLANQKLTFDYDAATWRESVHNFLRSVEYKARSARTLIGEFNAELNPIG